MTVTRDEVLEALKTVENPVGGGDIVSAGMVRALTVEDGTVRFVLEVDPKRASALEPARARAEALVKALNGVTNVSAVMTAHSAPAAPP